MSDRKGKGVLRDVHDDKSDQSGDTANLAQRVLASARGLATSFATPSSGEINRQVASSAGEAKIRQSNGADKSSWAESSTRSSHLDADEQYANSTASFRTHRDQHIADTEKELSDFLDAIDIQHTLTMDASLPSQTFDVEEFKATYHKPYITSDDPNRTIWPTDIARQEAQDGQDVLALLSSAGTNPAEQWEVYNQPLEEEPVVWTMSDAQRKAWQTRLQSDFPASNTNAARTSNSLNLNLIPAQGFNTEEERQTWIQQWRGVLDRYADEVWGDMLPLVEEARDELDHIKTENLEIVQEKPTALRRLGLVLGHLRNS